MLLSLLLPHRDQIHAVLSVKHRRQTCKSLYLLTTLPSPSLYHPIAPSPLVSSPQTHGMLSGRRAGLLLYDLLVSITNAQDHHFAPVFESTLSFPHRNQFIRNLSGYQVAKYDVLTFYLLDERLA